jgi:hypothetical protein
VFLDKRRFFRPCEWTLSVLSECGRSPCRRQTPPNNITKIPGSKPKHAPAMSRPVSVASSQSMLPPPVPTKASFVDNGDLFATNLRLLNLDQLEDWPGISNKTFFTKDAQQNQKQRIRCTEWALYRLFDIWDPEDTRNVFIPPLVSSIHD